MPNHALTFRVLHVEDDDDHHELFRLAITADDAPVEIARARDGASAMACFDGQPPFPGAVPPDLVVLDLKIPAPDGHEVLEYIKQHPRLRRIPVVILSTSSSERDVRRALESSANAYVSKPTTASGFEDLAADLRAFWESWNVSDPDRDLTLRN